MVFVHALGTAQIDAGPLQITPGSVRKFSLLMYLAAEAGRCVPRVRVCELIYPDLTARGAAHSLRELVYQLRRVGVTIDTDGDAIGLPADEVNSDLGQLLERDIPSTDELRAAEGGFLPGYAPSHSDAFTAWLESYRATTALQLRKYLLTETRRAKRNGDWTRAERAARACLTLDPLNEEATLSLAEVLAIGGSKVGAVRVLDTYIDEVKVSSASLAQPARRLRRRIGERGGLEYVTAPLLPFSGRAAEMSLLNDRLQRAGRGDPQCVVLHGEPGIGKSRIAAEFGSQAHLAGCAVIRTACAPHELSRPLGVFVDIVPALLRVPGALGCAPESMEWLQRLSGVAAVASPAERSADEIAAAITRAIVDLIDAIASESTLVMVIDDVQWSDEGSLRVFESLLAGGARRLIVVMTTRDERALVSLNAHERHLDFIGVARLSSATCVGVLRRAVLEPSEIGDALCEWMAETSGGNPFYLESLLAHYRATGESFAIPDKVTGIVDQRVKLLRDDARAVLAVVVALEKFATLERVVAVLELPTERLLQALHELESANLLRQADFMMPAHRLVADGIVRNTTPLARQFMHRRIAHVLEAEVTRGANRNPGQLWACAEHWGYAGDAARSAESFAECAAHSLSIGRLRESGELYLRAAEAASGERRHQFAVEAARASWPISEPDICRRAAGFIDRSRMPVHCDVELIILQSFLISDSAYDESLAGLKSCVIDDSADLNHRLNAGLAVFTHCDQSRRIETALEIAPLMMQLWTQTDPDSVVSLQAQVVYYSTYGHYTGVVAPARRLLAGEDIPLAARIIRFADTIDAMTTQRPYRAPLSEAQVRAEVIHCRARQFDPNIADALLRSHLWSSLFVTTQQQLPNSGLAIAGQRQRQRKSRLESKVTA